MPTFSWEPLDFLEALEVPPVEEEYGAAYRYLVSRASVFLSLTIWPLNCDVEIVVGNARGAEPLVRLNLLDCPGARVIRDDERTYIEFCAAKVFGGRFDQTYTPPYGFRMQIEPFIQISTFLYPV